jgi:hypothetical protein
LGFVLGAANQKPQNWPANVSQRPILGKPHRFHRHHRMVHDAMSRGAAMKSEAQ